MYSSCTGRMTRMREKGQRNGGRRCGLREARTTLFLGTPLVPLKGRFLMRVFLTGLPTGARLGWSHGEDVAFLADGRTGSAYFTRLAPHVHRVILAWRSPVLFGHPTTLRDLLTPAPTPRLASSMPECRAEGPLNKIVKHVYE